MATATVRDPVVGLMRTTRLPTRSVTHKKPSGPHVSSHGPLRPVVTTREANGSGPCVVSTRGLVEDGGCCARGTTNITPSITGTRTANRAASFLMGGDVTI